MAIWSDVLFCMLSMLLVFYILLFYTSHRIIYIEQNIFDSVIAPIIRFIIYLVLIISFLLFADSIIIGCSAFAKEAGVHFFEVSWSVIVIDSYKYVSLCFIIHIDCYIYVRYVLQYSCFCSCVLTYVCMCTCLCVLIRFTYLLDYF